MSAAATRLEELIERSRQLSPMTKRAYLKGVRSFLGSAGRSTRHWTPAAVDDWIESLMGSVSPQTVRLHVGGLKWASRRRAAMDEGKDFAAAADPPRTTTTIRPNRALSPDEARRLIAACADSPRDRAIVLLGLRAGLRRNEIAGRRWIDLDLVQGTLRLTGKGGRAETVRLDETTLDAFKTLPEFADGNGFVFIRSRPPLDRPPSPLSADGVYRIIKMRLAQAGIANAGPHTLRHTCASLLIAAGVPPRRVQEHLRHRGPVSEAGLLPSVTRTYIHELAGTDAPSTALDRLLKEETP